ncbi:MAG: EAL domain-containing protein, partial [Pseudomonadota bacterium]|nr:EAL domain-containing protein [Pseudomonadota bacterium]
LVNDEFTLHVQPQWDTQRKMIGAEALLRWQHPERGLVSPGVFIPLAEETRLILPIGEWVLRTACQWLSEWRLDETMSDFILSVNVSAVQFSQEDFVQQVQRILSEYDVAAGALQLELTESMLAHDQQDIITKMSELKALGVLISLDDFGTGYSSLSYLHQLPIDQLKIDQSFVANIEQGEKNASLAESIISLGHNLGMEVIAEGVETEAQFTWLAEQGCDLFQGFGLAKPMSITELLDSLK